jgi:hypothetical protein
MRRTHFTPLLVSVLLTAAWAEPVFAQTALTLAGATSPSPPAFDAAGGRVTFDITVTNAGVIPLALDQFVLTNTGLSTLGAVAGSSTWGGILVTDPVVSSGTATWSGVFAVPAHSSRVLHFAIGYTGI